MDAKDVKIALSPQDQQRISDVMKQRGELTSPEEVLLWALKTAHKWLEQGSTAEDVLGKGTKIVLKEDKEDDLSDIVEKHRLTPKPRPERVYLELDLDKYFGNEDVGDFEYRR